MNVQPSSSATPLEIEVKFFLETPETVELVRRRLLGLGGRTSGPVFESNIRFEDPEGGLFRRKSLLRLRRDQGIRLTFKSETAEAEALAEYKVFRELETTVGDFDAMKAILEALGFHAEQTYEKWRETIRLENGVAGEGGHIECCLDRMPFGHFLEIEGEPAGIRRLSDELGMAWDRRMLKNYLSLFAEIRRALDLPFTDLTFARFEAARPPAERLAAVLRDMAVSS